MAQNKYNYDIVKESPVEKYEELPKHFLADTQEEAEDLYKEFYSLLNNLSYSYSLSTNIDKSDLFGEALIGLARAKRDFDPSRSDKFKIFAIYKIKSALNDYIRRNMTTVVIPAYVRNAHRHIGLLIDLMKSCGIDSATLHDAIKENALNLDDIPSKWLRNKALSTFKKLQNTARNAGISLKELVRRAEFIPADIKYNEYLDADDVVTAEEQRVQMILFIESIKKHLNKRENEIIEMILNGKNNADIAKHYKLTPSRIGQIIRGIGTKLEKKGITIDL